MCECGNKDKFKEYFASYFASDEPVCREERQYALFLYNILLNAVGKDINTLDNCQEIIKGILNINDDAQLENIKILSVAYEATFMRDLFEKDRFERFKEWLNKTDRKLKVYDPYERAVGFHYRNDQEFIKSIDSRDVNNPLTFNYVLVEYLFKENLENRPIKYLDNVNLGSNSSTIEFDADGTVSKCRVYVKIKPDLSILYSVHNEDSNKDEVHMKFIECKYLSDESVDGVELQSDAQGEVCKFICHELLEQKVVSDSVQIVRFESKLNESIKFGENEIRINIKDIMPQQLIDSGSSIRDFLGLSNEK